MEQALSDVTVLDLGQVIAMPFCTMLLADLGARVIKVESRERGRERLSLGIKRVRNGKEERVMPAQYRDRNKQAITLELKTPQGVALFKELVKHADVVTENFSVGTMERLGLGYEDLRAVNPRIVYASVTAFGQHGPYAMQRGYDILAQAISGYLSITGFPENPPTKSGQSISDYYAGMLCAFSIVSALHYRNRTGVGQRIDMALLDSLVVALDNLGERYTVGGEVLTRSGNVAFTGSSTGVYATINNVAEMVADPQVQAREMFVERDHPVYGRLKTTGSPLKMSVTPGRVRTLAPVPGEHNEEIFCGLLGHSKDELARWRDEGVI
jgi:CoA:oxalate CoA-transferase